MLKRHPEINRSAEDRANLDKIDTISKPKPRSTQSHNNIPTGEGAGDMAEVLRMVFSMVHGASQPHAHITINSLANFGDHDDDDDDDDDDEEEEDEDMDEDDLEGMGFPAPWDIDSDDNDDDDEDDDDEDDESDSDDDNEDEDDFDDFSSAVGGPAQNRPPNARPGDSCRIS